MQNLSFISHYLSRHYYDPSVTWNSTLRGKKTYPDIEKFHPLDLKYDLASKISDPSITSLFLMCFSKHIKRREDESRHVKNFIFWMIINVKSQFYITLFIWTLL